MNLDDSSVTSAYNEGMFQIQRLHNLWTQANYQSKLGKYREWRWTLDNIWRELVRDAIKKEEGKIKPEDFDDLEEKNPWFKQWKKVSQQVNDAEMKDMLLKKQNPKMKVEIGRHRYHALSNMEVFLRSLQDVVGKGGKYKTGDEDDMD